MTIIKYISISRKIWLDIFRSSICVKNNNKMIMKNFQTERLKNASIFGCARNKKLSGGKVLKNCEKLRFVNKSSKFWLPVYWTLAAIVVELLNVDVEYYSNSSKNNFYCLKKNQNSQFIRRKVSLKMNINLIIGK